MPSRFLFLFCAVVLSTLHPVTSAEAEAADPSLNSSPPPTYSSPGVVEGLCGRIANKLSSVSLEECLGASLRDSGGRSVEKAPILIKDYKAVEGRKPRGKVLLFGGIHGDEYSSVTIVFKWMSILDRFHSGLFEWRVIPLLNPDGMLRRKSQRMNGRGVDLNRNFPCPDWHSATHDYWVRRTSRNPRRYPGKDPLSEPESAWLQEQIESYDPDIIISVHAPHGIVDFDGPPQAPEQLGSLELNLLGTYPGSLGRYAGVQLGLPTVTVELASAGSMPSVDDQWNMWRDLIRWLKSRLPEDEQSKPLESGPVTLRSGD